MIKEFGITGRVNNITLFAQVKCMNRRFIIQTLGMSLVILLVPFFINKSLALMPSASIGFNINKSISDANYLQFKIEATEYDIIHVWLEDGDGETIRISFNPQDDYDQGDYELVEEDDFLFIYFSSSTITYESESFENLVSLFLSEDDDSTFDLTDDPEITRIQIFITNSLKLYSIAFADNEDFDDPCWEKNASDWSNLNDFRSDGGDIDLSSTDIRFYNSYIQISNTALSSLHSYFPWSIGWNQPYFGWNQPYNYGWNQPSYGWNQPYYGYQQFYYPYGYQQSYNLNVDPWIWEGEPPAGWRPPPPPWYYQPPTLANDVGGYPFGHQQFFNPYGYQAFIADDDYNPYPPINWSRVIWQDPFSGYDPITGAFFII